MQRLVKEEEKQQEKVALLQKELQSTVPRPVLAPLSEDLTEAQKKAGVSEEQLEATRAHLAKPAEDSYALPETLQASKEGTSADPRLRRRRRSRAIARAGMTSHTCSPSPACDQIQQAFIISLWGGTTIPGIGPCSGTHLGCLNKPRPRSTRDSFGLTRASSPAYPVQEWRPTGPRWFQPWMNPQHDKPHHEQEDIPPAHLPQWEKPQAERSSLAAEPRVLEVAKADLNPRPPTLVTTGREGNNSPGRACFGIS